MRQAIKSDGSDGTAALATFLAENDEFLTQELYEFIKPGLGLVVGSPPAYGAPGSDSGVAQPRDQITSVKAMITMYTIPGAVITDPFTYFNYSIDGGAHWNGIIGGSALAHTPTEFTVDITAAIVAAGGIDSFDFGLVQIQAYNQSSLLEYDTEPGWQMYVSHVGLRFGYASGPTFDMLTTQNAFTNDPSGSPPDWATYSKYTLDASDGYMARWFSATLGGYNFPGWLYWGWVPSLGGGVSSGDLSATLTRVCDASSALTYGGNVYAPANIKNDGFKSKIGLDVDSLQLSWIFRGDEPMVTDPDTGATILTMLQAFRYGLWAGVWVKWRRIYMPTFGDCETLSAVSMFRGRIADIQIDRLTAKITVNSVTEMFNRQIPQQLIEANNRSGQIGAGLPPDLDSDPTHWTVFECVAGEGGTVQKIVASQTAPSSGEVYAPGTFDLGYLLFQASPLQFFVAQVQHYDVEGGYNVFYLFKPLYVDPHPYGLKFVAFVPVPKDQAISGAGGVELPPFLYVPLPEQAV